MATQGESDRLTQGEEGRNDVHPVLLDEGLLGRRLYWGALGAELGWRAQFWPAGWRQPTTG